MKAETIKRLRKKYCELYLAYLLDTEVGDKAEDYFRGMSEYKLLMKVAHKLKEACTDYAHRQFTRAVRPHLKDRVSLIAAINYHNPFHPRRQVEVNNILAGVSSYINNEGWRD